MRRCGICNVPGHTRKTCVYAKNLINDAKTYYLDWLVLVVNGYFHHQWKYSDDVRANWSTREMEMYDKVMTPDLQEQMDRLCDLENNNGLNTMLNTVTKYVLNLSERDLNAIYTKIPNVSQRRTCTVYHKQHMVHRHLINTMDQYICHVKLDNIAYDKYVYNSLNLVECYNQMVSSVYGFGTLTHTGNPIVFTYNDFTKTIMSGESYVDNVAIRRTLIERIRTDELNNRRQIQRRIASRNESIRTIEPRVHSITLQIQKWQLEIEKLRLQQQNILNSRPTLETEIEQLQHDQTIHERNIQSFYSKLPLPPPPPPIFSIKPVLSTVEDTLSSRSTECCICYEDNLPDNQICKTDCGHSLCVKCIMPVFQLQSAQSQGREKIKVRRVCPYCRQKVQSLHGDILEVHNAVHEYCVSNSIPHPKDVTRRVVGECELNTSIV